MLSALHYRQINNLVRTLFSVVLVASAAAMSHAAIINSTGLTHVRFWEVSGPTTPYTFVQNGPEMSAQLGLGILGPVNNDFSGIPIENYDVFYSDANGNFNLNGNYVTVEAVYPNPGGGGGLNLAAVDLIIGGSPVRADILASWVGLGPNYIGGSEVRAVDLDNAPLPPSTFTTMGSTVIPPVQHMRVTVTWTQFVPEPSSLGLGAMGLLGILARRRSAQNL